MCELYGNYPEDILSLPVELRAMIWAAHGEGGVSSNTIFSVMTGTTAVQGRISAWLVAFRCAA